MKSIFIGESVTAKYLTSDSKQTNQYYELQQVSLVGNPQNKNHYQ